MLWRKDIGPMANFRPLRPFGHGFPHLFPRFGGILGQGSGEGDGVGVMRSGLLAMLMVAASALPARAGFSFASIDGGTIALDDWAGKPVLVVNTASLCGFAPQFDELQALHDSYGPRGLLVLAVPSNDFRQELGTDAEVRDYCAANFDLTLPMTTISHVRGPEAHPFYLWMKAESG